MANLEEEPPKTSIQGFIEQTAKMLRKASKNVTRKKRIYSTKKNLSPTNKIEQIAKMLRAQVEKVTKRSHKKKK